MATEPALTFSLASVVEEILQQQAGRLDVNLASRKTEETCIYNPLSPFFSYQFNFFTFNSFFFCVCAGNSLPILFFLATKCWFQVSTNK